MDEIRVTGARIHNLKNINVSIPKHKIVAITGVSGSGKSSLAFDIVYNEGMRRYLESIGFPPKVEEEKPFDFIEGLSPCIAVEQRVTRVTNPRSTVGTRTMIYNMLRMLYALESKKTCQVCLVPIEGDECDLCGMKPPRMEIKHFSFNEPSGMCLECKGRGYIHDFTEKKIIPDEEMSLTQILKAASGAFGDMLNFTKGLAEALDFEMNAPWNTLREEIQDIFLYGTEEKMKLKWKSRRFEGMIEVACEGVIPHLERAMKKSVSAYRRMKIEQNYMTKKLCPECAGHRVNSQARNALVNGKHIGELASIPIDEIKQFMESIKDFRTGQGKALRNEIVKRLKNFDLVGLSYLHLNRNLPTLSGGELQRLALLTHLDSTLDSIVYILDEPTMGMHELEKNNLKKILNQLKDLGNSIIIVEHDLGTIKAADHIIDVGPGAGTAGGELIYSGEVSSINTEKKSITGQYLGGKLEIPMKKDNQRRKPELGKQVLVLKDVLTNNLKSVEVTIPLGVMVGICGVSGSGKSSLIMETLIPLLKEHFKSDEKDNGDEEEFIEFEDIEGKLSGWENIAKVIVISQSPIGRTKTSNPASYTGIWDEVRKLFAKLPEAKKRKYKNGHFSFNSDSGRCPQCKGLGTKDLQISFLSSVDIPCEECNGTGYKSEILEIEFNGKNIRDVLNLTVSEALELFDGEEKITRILGILDEIGMGYITLG
ncbi:MAG: excinuclease ABC subunit UvrA, partial [Candidatus Hodarchaeota archaeon]